MRFLLTNDDGFDAPGLKALCEALRPYGECTVVAPAVCHSAKGHAIGSLAPISVERRHIDGLDEVHIVESTPANCVRIGLRGLDLKPDFVVAGINPGANLGVDTYYSGTVAAAHEAAILGCPAIAISQFMRADVPLNWKFTTQVASTCLGRLFEHSLASGEFWNVNIPAVATADRITGVAHVPQSTEPHDIRYQPVKDSGELLFEYSGNYGGRAAEQNADVRHIFARYITMTRLQLSASADAAAANSVRYETWE